MRVINVGTKEKDKKKNGTFRWFSFLALLISILSQTKDCIKICMFLDVQHSFVKAVDHSHLS